MPDSKNRLIEAATRPFSDNAEMKHAAAEMLSGNRVTYSADAIARWNAVDARRPRRWLKIALLCLLGLAAAFVAFRAARELFHYWKIRGMFLGGYTTGPVDAVKVIGKNLGPEEKLLVFREWDSALEQCEMFWKSDPENPAYFAEYVSEFQRVHDAPPPDFLETARRIDPGNAWFTYLAAAATGKDSVKKGETGNWEIKDAVGYERALELFHEAASQPRCEDYQWQMLVKRLALLPQNDFIESAYSSISLAMVGGNSLRLFHVMFPVSAKAWQVGQSGDIEGFRQLQADQEAFCRNLVAPPPTSLIEGTVFPAMLTGPFEEMTSSATKLGLTAEAERMTKIRERLQSEREARMKRDLRLEGKEPEEISGTVTGFHLEMFARIANEPPPLTAADLRPGRLMDHEIVSQWASLGAGILLMLPLAAVAGYRFRSGAMIRRMAGRMEQLLRPADVCWLIGGGVILPLAYVMAVQRLTPFGGRDLSLRANDLKISSQIVPMPWAQFLGAVVLMMILPVLIARWRLARRAGMFGFPGGIPWIGGLAAVCGFVFIPAIGWAAQAGIGEAITLLAVPASWPVAVGLRALFSRPQNLLHRSTAARALVPAYAAAVLLMIAMIPVFKAAEKHWLRQDRLTRFDPARPAPSIYQYEVLEQMRKELREALEGR